MHAGTSPSVIAGCKFCRVRRHRFSGAIWHPGSGRVLVSCGSLFCPSNRRHCPPSFHGKRALPCRPPRCVLPAGGPGRSGAMRRAVLGLGSAKSHSPPRPQAMAPCEMTRPNLPVPWRPPCRSASLLESGPARRSGAGQGSHGKSGFEFPIPAPIWFSTFLEKDNVARTRRERRCLRVLLNRSI